MSRMTQSIVHNPNSNEKNSERCKSDLKKSREILKNRYKVFKNSPNKSEKLDNCKKYYIILKLVDLNIN